MAKFSLPPRVAAWVESLVIVAGTSPVVVLGLGLLIALANMGAFVLELPWRERALDISCIAFALLALFEWVRHVATRSSPLPVRAFLAGSLMAGLGVRLAYVWFVQPEWNGDFLRYWDYGLDLARGGEEQIANIYQRRANLLTRPLIEIFGPRREVVPLVNVLLLTAVQAIGYDIVRRVRSHQAAQGFSILWIATPMPLLAAAVPNHDLAGILLLAVATWLGVIALTRRGRRSIATWLVLWSGAGVALSLLEAVRGLGAIALVAFALLVLAAAVVEFCRGGIQAPKRHVQRSATGLLVATAAYVCLGFIMNAAGALPPKEAQEYAALRFTTPNATSMTDGSYSFMYAFGSAFTRDLQHETDRFAEFRRSLLLSDFGGEPADRLQTGLSHMERQYMLGSEQTFFLGGIPLESRELIRSYSAFFHAGFAVLLLLALRRLVQLRATRLSVDHYLLLLTALVSIALLTIGASQSRYLSFIWLAGAIAIPSQLSFRDRAPACQEGIGTLLATRAIFMISLLTIGWIATVALFRPANGRIFDEWTYQARTIDGTVPTGFFEQLQGRRSTILVGPSGRTVPVDFDELSLKLMLPEPPARSTSASASTTACGLAPDAGLEFHYDAPAKHILGRDAFSLHVEANGERIWSAALPNPEGPQRVRLRLPTDADRCSRITFTLSSTSRASRPSWQRASFVEVFFPRIVEAP